MHAVVKVVPVVITDVKLVGVIPVEGPAFFDSSILR
jgi:hypothetical protein